MLLTKVIEVTWHVRNIKYYESYGYKYTKLGDSFEIPIDILPRHSKLKVDVKCDYCGNYFRTKYTTHKDGHWRIEKDSCIKCRKQKVDDIELIERGSLKDNYPKLMKEWATTNELDPSKLLSGTRKSADWVCEKGHKWHAPIKSRAHRGEGCPECYISKGETAVEETLIKLGEKFRREVSFDKLNGVWGFPLRFDFAVYIKDDLVGLIEYDGIFHFEEVYEGSGYENTIIHDRRKEEYCRENKIPYLIIPYTKFDEIDYLVSRFIDSLYKEEEVC